MARRHSVASTSISPVRVRGKNVYKFGNLRKNICMQFCANLYATFCGGLYTNFIWVYCVGYPINQIYCRIQA